MRPNVNTSDDCNVLKKHMDKDNNSQSGPVGFHNVVICKFNQSPQIEGGVALSSNHRNFDQSVVFCQSWLFPN